MTNDFDSNESFLANFLPTAKAILLSLRLFYEGMNRNEGLQNPMIFLPCCVVVHTLLVGLVLKDQSLVACNLVFGMVLSFVTAGILFYYYKAFQGIRDL